MKSLFVFAITGLVIFSSFSFDDRNLAHAYKCPDYSDAWGPYTAADLAKEDYKGIVDSFNSDVESRSGSIEDLNKIYIVGNDLDKDSFVDQLGQTAGCLYETHHINPDSVASFSDKAQAVLSYDMEKLIGVAPELADYATVPEFGSLVSVTMIVSVLGVILIHRKFQK